MLFNHNCKYSEQHICSWNDSQTKYMLFFRFVSDGTVAILMSMLFFVIPSQMPRSGGYGNDSEGEMIFPLTTNNTRPSFS